MDTTRTMPTVAFDEAGNTGPDLLSDDQPVFALASVYLSDTEAKDLVASVATNATELKFSTLRRRPRGRDAVVSLFARALDPKSFKATVTHKSFMATAKIVDLLVEPLAHLDGQDLYANGENIAMANMLHACCPAFIGQATYTDLQRAFVDMVRTRADDDFSKFFALCERLTAQHEDKEWAWILSLLSASITQVDSLRGSRATELDPAIPCFVQHCAAWGEHLGEPFDLVHDDSKPIAQEKDLLTMLMPADEPTVTVGADRRTFQLPLRATGIRFASSDAVPQLQLADLVASAAAYVGRYRATGSGDAGFVQALVDVGILNVVIDGLWPSLDVDPADLGTKDTSDGPPMMDHMADVVGSYMRKNKQPPAC